MKELMLDKQVFKVNQILEVSDPVQIQKSKDGAIEILDMVQEWLSEPGA